MLRPTEIQQFLKANSIGKDDLDKISEIEQILKIKNCHSNFGRHSEIGADYDVRQNPR